MCLKIYYLVLQAKMPNLRAPKYITRPNHKIKAAKITGLQYHIMWLTLSRLQHSQTCQYRNYLLIIFANFLKNHREFFYSWRLECEKITWSSLSVTCSLFLQFCLHDTILLLWLFRQTIISLNFRLSYDRTKYILLFCETEDVNTQLWWY